MKRILLFVTILLTACDPSLKESKVIDGPFLIRDGIHYFQSTNEPIVGETREFFENGQLKLSTRYRDGKKNGISEIFREDGQLRRSVTYQNGYKEGLEKSYNSDGSTDFIATYSKGKRNGTFLSYYADRIAKGSYLEGLRHGLWEVFTDRDEKIFVTNFSNGLPDGYSERYFDDILFESWECKSGEFVEESLKKTTENKTILDEKQRYLEGRLDEGTNRRRCNRFYINSL